MKQLLASGEYDAVFVGSGAPKGKDLDLPGRRASPAVEQHIHIGIDWLESVAFDHIKAIGRKVLIIGVGNTAMDCCRTSLRLGADDVKVMARKPRGFFKASEWELEDAEEENVEIVVNHSPKSFVVEGGKLTGMLFDKMEYDLDAERPHHRRARRRRAAVPVRRRDPGDRPGERVPVDRERPRASSSTSGTCRRSTRSRSSRRGRKCSSAATRRSARRTSSGRSSTATRRRSRFTSICQGQSVSERLPPLLNLSSRKMGIHEWSYKNDYNPVERRLMPHVDLKERFKKVNIEVELGFTAEQAVAEVQRCLNCDVQTVFTAKACIECDACIDICPVDCLTITPNGSEEELRSRLKAPARNLTQPLFVSAPLKQTARVMVKDEDVCVHCGLCAERCPTAAWDMQKSTIRIPYAGDETPPCSTQQTRKTA